MAFAVCELGVQYLPASINGLTFYIQSADLTIAPGAATAEFPGRGEPASIDTRKKADEYSLEGYITEPAMQAQAIAFRQMIEQGQPYTIIHPVHGLLTAGCRSFKMSDDFIQDRNVTKISFDGFEWGSLPDGGAGANGGLGGGFFDAVDGLISAATTAFFSLYNVQGLLGPDLARVQSAFDNASNDVYSATASAGAPPEQPRNPQDYRNPNAAWATLSTPLINFDNTAPVGRNAMLGLVKALGVSTTPSGAQASLEAIYQSTRVLAIIALGNAVLDGEYISPGQMCDARDTVIIPLKAEIQAASQRGATSLMRSMIAYLSAFSAELAARMVKKKPVGVYDFPALTNSIMISHSLYGDGSRFTEIEALNRGQLPSAMRGKIYALVA